MTEPVPFSKIARSRLEHFTLPLLADLMDKTFIIEAVKFESGNLGDYALVRTKQGDYRTSSKVLLEQLADIADHFTREGAPVKVKLISVKSEDGKMYYTFE